jgi:hypothetical protein
LLLHSGLATVYHGALEARNHGAGVMTSLDAKGKLKAGHDERGIPIEVRLSNERGAGLNSSAV